MATDILTKVLVEHKNDIYNPFLNLDGEYFPFDLCCCGLIYYSTGSIANVDTPVFMDSQSKTDVLSLFTIN